MTRTGLPRNLCSCGFEGGSCRFYLAMLVTKFENGICCYVSLMPVLFFLISNEHEGIPANLIQQLDVCVEIPQQGVIRSLNVHVSGALLIWEYTRQQIIKGKEGS